MILITGASGFVGAALTTRLAQLNKHDLRLAVRSSSKGMAKLGDVVEIESISANTDWNKSLAGVSSVIHCAARAHMMTDDSVDPLRAYRTINCFGTLQLASQAATAGVKRFIFISSIKVNGANTFSGRPFLADDRPAPQDAYGISKNEAEIGLRKIAEETEMEIIIIRPVLVYGPGVRANFLEMMRWLHKGIPLPFGAINNSRSFVALDNLVDFVVTCLLHPAAANQTFLVSDGEDLSTTELLKRTASALDTKARLIPVPESVLKIGAQLIWTRDSVQRLCSSLQVDISKTQDLLGWVPPLTVDQALKETAEYFLQHQLG